MKLIIPSLSLLLLGIIFQADSQTANPPPAEAIKMYEEMYNECLAKKSGCFTPPKCMAAYEQMAKEKKKTHMEINPERLCQVFVSWRKLEPEGYLYRVAGNTSPNGTGSYISMALSTDDHMAEDSAVICVHTTWNDPLTLKVGRYLTYDTKPHQAVPISSPPEAHQGHFGNLDFQLGIVPSSIKTVNVDGHLFCEFEQKSHKIWKYDFNMGDKQPWHIFIARGPVRFNDSAAGGPNKYLVGRHDFRLSSALFTHSAKGDITNAKNSTGGRIFDIYAIILCLIFTLFSRKC